MGSWVSSMQVRDSCKGKDLEAVMRKLCRPSMASVVLSLLAVAPGVMRGQSEAPAPAPVQPQMQAAQAAFVSWSRKPMQERADLLCRVAGL